jgi:hypothetical protein
MATGPLTKGKGLLPYRYIEKRGVTNEQSNNYPEADALSL